MVGCIKNDKEMDGFLRNICIWIHIFRKKPSISLYFHKKHKQYPFIFSTLSKVAKEHGIFLIGGTIPERDGEKLFNTCTIWNPNGELISKYRKMHLFDIDIPGKITFKESDALTGGKSFVSFSTPWTEIGIGICYDIRFADLAEIYARDHNCGLLVYPGAFNMTTGKYVTK